MSTLSHLLRAFALFTLFGLASCSSKTIRTESLSHETLFPYGKYKHSVKLKTIQNPDTGNKEFSFNGVVYISKDWIKIAVLSPFGTTLVRMQEDRNTGKVEIESYVESFKKYESKFQDYYSILKILLIAPEAPTAKDKLHVVQKNSLGLPAEIETIGLEQNAKFYFKKYDEHKIPEEVIIQHPRFTVEIKVPGYEV